MSVPWTCEECGARLRGHWAHCGLCCLTFGGSVAFDRHFKSVVNGGCRTEVELDGLRVKSTGARLLCARELDGVRVWQDATGVAASAAGNRVFGVVNNSVASDRGELENTVLREVS